MKRCVMVALVSEQPLPNIMAALQHDPPPEHVECIVSADKGDASRYDAFYEARYHGLRAVLRSLDISCDRMPPVHPYDLSNVKQVCLAAFDKHSEAATTVVNITGGTKLMALAAYHAAVEAGKPVVYVESRDRQLVLVSGDRSAQRRFDEARFDRISVERYLMAYGRSIRSETLRADLSDTDVESARFFVAELDAARPLLRMIMNGVCRGGDAIAPRCLRLDRPSDPGQREVLDYIVARGYVVASGVSAEFTVPSEDAWHFLNGRWLEVYAFDALLQSGFFDDVRANVVLEDTPGELDVVATRNAVLAICEAKLEAKLTTIMGRLRALKEILAGVYGHTFYLTARDALTPEMQDAARLYGVTATITGPELPRLHQVVRERM